MVLIVPTLTKIANMTDTKIKNLKAIELREDFIKFYRSNSHKLLAPSKIFNDDPTLLFVNAGMNQLKSKFLDSEDDSKTDDKFKRLCNSQICIRAGGKHNDLDDVGMDSYHLTSFEMLGNWSLNSYKKEEAIRLAFTYLTEHLGLDSNKMYATYFEGDKDQKIPEDIESKDIWLKYLPEERIVKGNFKNNFWMMSDTGPCGVCTEIHYDLDQTKKVRSVPELVNQDDPSLIEIWNIVFIQFNKKSDGSYENLSKFFVDTGMGMERLLMILQNKKTIYETDAFHYLMGYARAISNYEYSYSDCYDQKEVKSYKADCAYRIFCDHFRTIIIALFDGVEFDCFGRGHVLRKIFRRMLTHVYLYLNGEQIEQMMNRPIILGIISDVLNFYLKKIHDSKAIQQKLVDEENLFIGGLQHFKRGMNKILELNKINRCFDFVCQENYENKYNYESKKIEYSGDKKHLVEAQKFYDKLIKDGIPPLIVKHADVIKVKPMKK